MTDCNVELKRVETVTEKLRTLRHLCDCAHQPFYVEVLDEVLEAFELAPEPLKTKGTNHDR